MQALVNHLEQRVDGRAIGIARIVVGLAALVKGLLAAADISLLGGGEYILFPYDWQPVSIADTGAGSIVAACWIVFALFFMLGFGARLSGALLALAIFLVLWADQQLYSNHLYLLAMLVVLLTIAGPGGNYSIDQRLRSLDRTVPRWTTTLIRLQLTSVYFFAAVTKLNDDFLSGSILDMSLEPAMHARIVAIVSLSVMAHAAVVTELFLALAFWFRRLRWVALPVAVGFHVANVLVMDRGGALNFTVFGMIMAAMILLHFTDVLPRRQGETAPAPDHPVSAPHVAIGYRIAE